MAYFPLSLGNSITSEKFYSLYYDSVYTISEPGLLSSLVSGESLKESTFVATLTDMFVGLELTPGFGLPQSEAISESEIGAMVEELCPPL